MKTAMKRLKKMSKNEIVGLYDIIDNEMEMRAKPRIQKGFQRSTYLSDMVRGKRRAPRLETRYLKIAA